MNTKILGQFVLVFFLICILSCQQDNIEKDEINELEQHELFFAYGTNCGWGAIDDSLAVAENYLHYYYYSYLNQKEFQTTSSLSHKEWNELKDTLNRFNWDKFKLIDLNTCNICLDGCDYWLFIKYNNQTHRIRYGKDDLEEYPEVKALADMLMEMKTQQYQSVN